MSDDSAARPVTIRAEQISKSFGDFAALQGVSFSVRKGTVAAFLCALSPDVLAHSTLVTTDREGR